MNVETIHYLNMFLGAGAIILQIFSVVALFVLFLGPKNNKFLGFIDKHFLQIGFTDGRTFMMAVGSGDCADFHEVPVVVPLRTGR